MAVVAEREIPGESIKQSGFEVCETTSAMKKQSLTRLEFIANALPSVYSTSPMYHRS